MSYSPETDLLASECKEQGFNIWAMHGLFRKRSKLREEIPDEVINSVCREYLNRKGTIRADFPYFLMVLKRKSQEHFAQKNRAEHEAIKKEPLAIKDIFKQLAT